MGASNNNDSYGSGNQELGRSGSRARVELAATTFRKASSMLLRRPGTTLYVTDVRRFARSLTTSCLMTQDPDTGGKDSFRSFERPEQIRKSCYIPHTHLSLLIYYYD